MKEWRNIYKQHIRQPKNQQLAVDENLGACGGGKFNMCAFFQDSLRK